MKFLRSLLAPFLALLLAPALHAITVSESNATLVPGNDFPDSNSGVTPTAYTYTLTSGTNTFSGTVTNPADYQDNFNVVVPAGMELLSSSETVIGGNFDGFVSFNYEAISYAFVASGSGTFTGAGSTPYPLGSGTYPALIAENSSSGTAWTMTIVASNLPDYTITSSGSTLMVTNVTNNGDTLTVAPSSSGAGTRVFAHETAIAGLAPGVSRCSAPAQRSAL